jgi:hypothetical protein
MEEARRRQPMDSGERLSCMYAPCLRTFSAPLWCKLVINGVFSWSELSSGGSTRHLCPVLCIPCPFLPVRKVGLHIGGQEAVASCLLGCAPLQSPSILRVDSVIVMTSDQRLPKYLVCGIRHLDSPCAACPTECMHQSSFHRYNLGRAVHSKLRTEGAGTSVSPVQCIVLSQRS